MGINDNLIKKMRLKIAFLLSMRYQLFSFTILCFLLGIVILIVRAIFPVSRQVLLWTSLCLIPAAVWSIVHAVRKTPSRKVLYAVFDERNKCGGLLMAALEVDLGSWQQQLSPLGNIKLKWHGGRRFCLFMASVVFVTITFLIPQRYVTATSARPLNISEDIEKLQQQIDILEEETIVSEEKAREYEQKLEQLRDNASGYDPVRTWEALDHLQQSVEKQADQFTAAILSQTENLTRAETLAQGLSEDGAELDEDLFSEAMSELSAMIQSCTAENESLKDCLSSDCINACNQGTLSAEQLKELLKALNENKANMSDCLAKLCSAGLVNPEMLKLCNKLGECNSKELMAFLNENANSMGMCDAVSLYCQCPGKGGIDRGRGDAPMTWTDGSDEQGASFKEEVLPPASLEALKESLTLGVSFGAPSVDKNSQSSSADALNSATAGSGEALTHTILPRHKGVVKRYFERR